MPGLWKEQPRSPERPEAERAMEGVVGGEDLWGGGVVSSRTSADG